MPAVSRTAPPTTSFDFNPHHIAADYGLSTIKELLREINRELESSDSGKNVSLKSLARTLAFIGQFTGREYRDVNENLPVYLLKTAKALYQASLAQGAQGKRSHIFEYLRLPREDGPTPTFEFRLGKKTVRNSSKTRLTRQLLVTLGRGIHPTRRTLIRGFLLTPTKLLTAIALENQSITAPIREALHQHPDLLPYAYLQLSRQILAYRSPVPLAGCPVHEALYTRILSLPFIHHAGEFQITEQLAKFDFSPQRADSEILSLAKSLGPAINPYQTRFIAVSDVANLFKSHATALVKITCIITQQQINRRDLDGKLDYIKKILHLLVADPNKPMLEGTKRLSPEEAISAKELSLADLTAALCTVAHQQKVKTSYKASFQGQTSVDGKQTSLLRQLTEELSIADLYEEDYVPQGVHQVLLSRLNQFHAHILGIEDLYYAKSRLRVARLIGYAHCLENTMLEYGRWAVNGFNSYCKSASSEFAERVLHDRSTVLHI